MQMAIILRSFLYFSFLGTSKQIRKKERKEKQPISVGKQIRDRPPLPKQYLSFRLARGQTDQTVTE